MLRFALLRGYVVHYVVWKIEVPVMVRVLIKGVQRCKIREQWLNIGCWFTTVLCTQKIAIDSKLIKIGGGKIIQKYPNLYQRELLLL